MKKSFKKYLKISSKEGFDIKATTIEEAQHISKIKIDDLINSLLTLEMAIDDKYKKKSKKKMEFKVDAK